MNATTPPDELDFDLTKDASSSDIAASNAQLLSYLENAGNGELVKMAAPQARRIRRELTENGFARNIFGGAERITHDMLDKAVEHDMPRLIREMEGAQVRPTVVPFGAVPQLAPMRGRKYEILFFEIQTPEFIAHMDRLRTWGHDLQAAVTDRMLVDMMTTEDEYLIATVDTAVGTTSGVGAAGMNQHNAVSGDITSRNYAAAIKSPFINRRLPQGSVLLNHHTTLAFEGWSRDEWGGDICAEVRQRGLTALPKLMFGGVQHIVTIKSNTVPNNYLYRFTEPERLGNFCELEGVRVFSEKRRDWIRTSALTKVAITIAQAAGLHLVEFVP